MKYLIVLVAALSLQGCYQAANNVDIEKAIYFCKGAENVEELLVSFDGNEKIFCKNGNKEMVNKINLP